MFKQQEIPINNDLVLIGGGHSHIMLIMELSKRPIEGTRITLISNEIDTPYSGMIPGFIEGMYTWRETHIDLYKLCFKLNIRFIHSEVLEISAINKEIILKNRPKIKFDVLSINTGIQSSNKTIKGALKYCIPVKPISKLSNNFLTEIKKNNNIAFIGGGPASVELALGLQKRFKNTKSNLKISIITGKNGLLSSFPNKTRKAAKQTLQNAQINVIEKVEVIEVQKDTLILSDKTKLKIDKSILSTNGMAPEWIKKSDIILHIFLTEGKAKKVPINSMPNVFRYSIDKLKSVVDKALRLGIPMVALFPYTNPKKKDEYGNEALNENNLVCQAIKFIKKNYKNENGIMCDVALDPYTSHGHDGIIKKNEILNDETLEILIKQSILQAKMGCDVIAPSDMMDGRVLKIRKALDKNNLKDVQILSYAVKYASSFYGPFRNAVGSRSLLKGDKKTYQMDFKNNYESLREVALDIKEGADMIIVKPGMPYLDIIREVKNNFKIPVIAYQVSGEYSLIQNAISKNILDKKSIYESLVSFKRAGASAIITYFADQIKLD